jgi:hypothetical protein
VDRIPEDIRVWLRQQEREAPTLDKEGRRQLAEVLGGPLMQPVWKAISERLEGMKDRMLALEMSTDEAVTQARAIQAESRGIIAVLELMWETTNDVD